VRILNIIQKDESVKIINEIVIPHVKKQREKLGLKKDKKALLIVDVLIDR